MTIIITKNNKSTPCAFKLNLALEREALLGYSVIFVEEGDLLRWEKHAPSPKWNANEKECQDEKACVSR